MRVIGPTSAIREGNDFVLQGSKFYVSGGTTADFYAVLANVEEDAAGPGGTAMLIVDRESTGLELGPEFHGIEGGSHCQLFFHSVRVPQSNLVGSIGEGMQRGLRNIGELRLSTAAHASGTSMWACDYTKERISQPHRTGGTLGDREQVRWMFGSMLIDCYAARSVLYRTARLAESGADVTNEGAIAKVFATEAAGRVVDKAIQLAGGQSLIQGHALERLYRQVRSERLAEGSSEILRMNIARGLLEFGAGRL